MIMIQDSPRCPICRRTRPNSAVPDGSVEHYEKHHMPHAVAVELDDAMRQGIAILRQRRELEKQLRKIERSGQHMQSVGATAAAVLKGKIKPTEAPVPVAPAGLGVEQLGRYMRLMEDMLEENAQMRALLKRQGLRVPRARFAATSVLPPFQTGRNVDPVRTEEIVTAHANALLLDQEPEEGLESEPVPITDEEWDAMQDTETEEIDKSDPTKDPSSPLFANPYAPTPEMIAAMQAGG